MTYFASNIAGRAHEAGMTLIEILVAIVVLSVGLLGLAGLQIKGIQVNQGSVYRWQASMLAEDIADRIRADNVGASNGNYKVTGGVAAGTGSLATQSAVTDWLARVSTLPGGTATIPAPVKTASGSNQVTITVGWTDARAQTGSGVASGATAPGSFVLTTEF
jgi:type IV pilus assembly protein PilV